MRTLITKLSEQDTIARLLERLQASPLAHRLARGAAWSLIGAVSTRVLTLASSIIVVRLLGKETVGEYGIVQSTLAMFGTFAGLGLGLTATKYTAEFRTSEPDRVGRILGVIVAVGALSGTAMAIAGWACSDWLAASAFKHPPLAPYLRMSAILVLIGVVDGVLNSSLAGFEAFGRIAKVSIYVSLVNVLLTAPLVYWFGLYGAVASLIASTTMHLILTGFALFEVCRRHGVQIRLDRVAGQEWPMLVHYALPALAAGVVVIPATWLGNLILVRADNGTASMGVLNVVNTWRNLVIYLPTALLAPVFAVLSNVAEDPIAVQRTMRYGLGISALTVLPAGIAIAALGSYVLGFLYGPEFAGEGLVLACGMMVVAVQAMGSSLGNFVSATGRMWFGLGINLLWGLSFLAIALALIPWFGVLGYMGAMVLAHLIGVLVVYVIFGSKLPGVMRCYPLCRVLAIFAAFMVAAIYVNQNFNLAYSVVFALLLSTGMAGILIVPMTRWRESN